MKLKLTTAKYACICSTVVALNLTSAYAQEIQTPIQETVTTHGKELDVVGENSKIYCPTKLVQGEIVGITHAVHQGMLSLTHTAYKRSYTVFSIAVGDKTFTTKYPGIVHKKDFVGAVTLSDCREPTAAVIPVGPLLPTKTK